MANLVPGYGDEATWGRCNGHPGDPRTEPDFAAETIRMAIYDAEALLGRAQRAAASGDYKAAFDLLSFAGEQLMEIESGKQEDDE